MTAFKMSFVPTTTSHAISFVVPSGVESLIIEPMLALALEPTHRTSTPDLDSQEAEDGRVEIAVDQESPPTSSALSTSTTPISDAATKKGKKRGRKPAKALASEEDPVNSLQSSADSLNDSSEPTLNSLPDSLADISSELMAQLELEESKKNSVNFFSVSLADVSVNSRKLYPVAPTFSSSSSPELQTLPTPPRYSVKLEVGLNAVEFKCVGRVEQAFEMTYWCNTDQCMKTLENSGVMAAREIHQAFRIIAIRF